MENPQIIQMIEDLKGRRNYEENKATKLGFSSLYAYYEHRILKEEAIQDNKNELEEIKTDNKLQNKEKKGCGCC
jgi:hypothetical protein